MVAPFGVFGPSCLCDLYRKNLEWEKNEVTPGEIETWRWKQLLPCPRREVKWLYVIKNYDEIIQVNLLLF